MTKQGTDWRTILTRLRSDRDGRTWIDRRSGKDRRNSRLRRRCGDTSLPNPRETWYEGRRREDRRK